MKTITYFCRLVLISMFLMVTSCQENGQFTLLDNSVASLDDYRGQWLIINFWAEWCSPCREEVQELNKLDILKEKDKSFKISVLGVSYDPISNQELERVVELWSIKYPVMKTEPSPILPFSLPKQLPTNYLINPQGEIVTKLVGKQNYQSIIDAIKKAQQQQ